MSIFIATRGRGPGQYWPAEIMRDPFTVERMTAIVYCPKCGNGFSLDRHTIAPDGTVTPSVVEPRDPGNSCFACPNPRCGTFHEFVRLDGWIP